LALNGYIGQAISIDTPQQVTVLLTYYHPARMRRINSVVRNYLKCKFVEKVVITNHNPNIKIEDKLNIRDERVICINQDIQRGNGYRWRVANTLDGEYFIVIDDDVMLFPSQLKNLFQHLISEPEIPHGYAGQVHLSNDRFEYRERENVEVDYLCELYAVTKYHITRYLEILQLACDQNAMSSNFVERFGEHIVISQTAAQNPKIHKINRLLRSETFKSTGIATHKEKEFEDAMVKISYAVKKLKMQTLAEDPQSVG
jgi:hypothetical protein